MKTSVIDHTIGFPSLAVGNADLQSFFQSMVSEGNIATYRHVPIVALEDQGDSSAVLVTALGERIEADLII